MSPPPTAEVPYGTLDLMVLKTLAALGPLHGYGIARRIEQVAEGALALNQGTIYPACSASSRRAGSAASGARARTTGGPASTASRRPAGSSSMPRRSCGRAPSRWSTASWSRSRDAPPRAVRPPARDVNRPSSRGRPARRVGHAPRAAGRRTPPARSLRRRGAACRASLAILASWLPRARLCSTPGRSPAYIPARRTGRIEPSAALRFE